LATGGGGGGVLAGILMEGDPTNLPMSGLPLGSDSTNLRGRAENGESAEVRFLSKVVVRGESTATSKLSGRTGSLGIVILSAACFLTLISANISIGDLQSIFNVLFYSINYLKLPSTQALSVVFKNPPLFLS
jgi:hypothetical protein